MGVVAQWYWCLDPQHPRGTFWVGTEAHPVKGAVLGVMGRF